MREVGEGSSQTVPINLVFWSGYITQTLKYLSQDSEDLSSNPSWNSDAV